VKRSEQQPFQLVPWTEGVGVGRAFGTFGELLQGQLGEEQTDFLVTLPIDRYSYAIFVADGMLPDVLVFPPEKQKSQMLARRILAQYALPPGGRLILQSELPIGKGLASSSADLVATTKAISSCFHLQVDAAVLAILMCQIEPSDGVMYPGAVTFHHRQGLLREFFGVLPPLTILGIDEGGALDTMEFNRRRTPFTTREADEYQHLLVVLSRALRQRDFSRIGQVATRSAVMNQARNPKQLLDMCIAVCKDIDGLGVVAAHSGTCLGILLPTDGPGISAQVRQAHHALSQFRHTVREYHSFCRFCE
jgi:uncharacterized protein involved in propanediol utilization